MADTETTQAENGGRARPQTRTALVDRFVPPLMQGSGEDERRARMFLGSHLYGPFLGLAVILYLYAVDPAPGIPPAVMAAAIVTFWIFPFLLRATGAFKLLTLLSLGNLSFIILFGAFHYGGAASPFMPWVLTIPLFTYFYLGDARRLPVIVLIGLGGALGVLYAYEALGYALPRHVEPADLSRLGIVSVFCAGVYVTAMALYNARVIAARAALERELQTERRTATLLQAAKDAAELADRTKSDFLATMSHELRTPLNAIIGFSEIMKGEAFGPLGAEKYRGYAQDIHESGNHLLAIINEILDLAKFQAGEAELDEELLDLAVEVDAACRLMRQRVEKARLVLVNSVPAQLPLLRADRRRLKQVLLNLLANAVKFTPAGGYIEVTAAAGGEGLALAVRDTGIGIAGEHLDKITRPFFQVDSTLGRRHEGSGLGLAVVATIVQQHGGTLSFESAPGEGTLARVAFPPQRLAARPATPLPAPAAPVTARPAIKGGTPAILVVDDDETMRDVLMRMLERTGFAVETAVNGRDALEKFAHRYADVVVTDLEMPEMDGIELIRHLTAEHPSVRIIAISGSTERLNLIRMALGFGAHAAMQKPIMRHDLVETLRSLLKGDDARPRIEAAPPVRAAG